MCSAADPPPTRTTGRTNATACVQSAAAESSCAVLAGAGSAKAPCALLLLGALPQVWWVERRLPMFPRTAATPSHLTAVTPAPCSSCSSSCSSAAMSHSTCLARAMHAPVVNGSTAGSPHPHTHTPSTTPCSGPKTAGPFSNIGAWPCQLSTSFTSHSCACHPKPDLLHSSPTGGGAVRHSLWGPQNQGKPSPLVATSAAYSMSPS
jgi:hypothetical protein